MIRPLIYSLFLLLSSFDDIDGNGKTYLVRTRDVDDTLIDENEDYEEDKKHYKKITKTQTINPSSGM